MAAFVLEIVGGGVLGRGWTREGLLIFISIGDKFSCNESHIKVLFKCIFHCRLAGRKAMQHSALSSRTFLQLGLQV